VPGLSSHEGDQHGGGARAVNNFLAIYALTSCNLPATAGLKKALIWTAQNCKIGRASSLGAPDRTYLVFGDIEGKLDVGFFQKL